MVAVGEAGAFVVETPRVPVELNGCGDVTAALFLARLLRGEPSPTPSPPLPARSTR